MSYKCFRKLEVHTDNLDIVSSRLNCKVKSETDHLSWNHVGFTKKGNMGGLVAAVCETGKFYIDPLMEFRMRLLDRFPKGNQTWNILLKGLDAEAEAIVCHLMQKVGFWERSWCCGKIKGRRTRMTQDEMVGMALRLSGQGVWGKLEIEGQESLVL